MKQKIFVISMVLFMIFNQIPIVGAESTKLGAENTTQTQWYDNIEEMLSKDYVEGEVIVGIDPTKKSFNLNSLFGGQKISYNGRELSKVSESSLDNKVNSKISQDTNKNIDIKVIKRHDMTTRQLLTELKKDRSVIFAEPNYIEKKSDLTSTSTSAMNISNETSESSQSPQVQLI